MKRMYGRIFRFFKILGPGLVTGSSHDDPSGIATYSQAGAATGFPPRGRRSLPFRFDKDFISILVAILGTTISPYLFFLQATMVSEDVIQTKKHHGSRNGLHADLAPVMLNPVHRNV